MVGPDGFFRPPCKRRDCARCFARRSRELARVLVLDARVEAPTVCVTLTSRDPDLDPGVYRRGSATLWRALRRRYGRADYFAAVEFTTGRRARDGRRRMHGHHLVKGVPADDVLGCESIVRQVWERATGAFVIEVAALVSPGAAIGYLGLHHRKPAQRPPDGWRGMIERHSRGYFHRPVDELRWQARDELRREAAAWSAAQRLGDASPELVGLEVEFELSRRDGHRWRLIEVARHGNLATPRREVGG